MIDNVIDVVLGVFLIGMAAYWFMRADRLRQGRERGGTRGLHVTPWGRTCLAVAFLVWGTGTLLSGILDVDWIQMVAVALALLLLIIGAFGRQRTA